MWSIWQRCGGDVAVGVGAALVPDLDGPSGRPGEEPGLFGALDPQTGRKDDPFEVGPLQPGHQGPGGDNGPPLDPADAPKERLIAHQDAEEGLGTPVARLGPTGAHRHLDQGIGPALGGTPGQLVGSWVTPERFCGRRPVGLEEQLFDPVELAGHDGPADRVEVPAQVVHPPHGLDHVDVTPGPAGHVGLFGPVGVGHLGEVGHRVGKGHEGEVAGRLDQGRLAAGEGQWVGVGHGRGRLDQHVDMGRGDVARGEGLCHHGHGGQGPAPAQLPPGLGEGKVTGAGNPRRGALCPRSRPFAPLGETGHRLCQRALVTRPSPLQGDNRGLVAIGERIGRDQASNGVDDILYEIHTTT